LFIKVERSMTPNLTKQTILVSTIRTNELASPFLATYPTIDRSFATILTIRAQGAAVPPLIALPAPTMKTDPGRPWRGPNKGPLTSIRVPNDPQRRSISISHEVTSDRALIDASRAQPAAAVAESVKRLAVPVLLDADEAAAFDLMEVQLTVYGLTGVVASKKEARISNRRKPNRFFSKRQQPPTTTQPTTTFTSTSTLEAASASIGTSQSLTSHESYEMPADDGVPVTAVVSFHRNTISSTTSLETFLPSQPLVASSSIRPGSSYRYQASWMRRKVGNEIRASSSKSSVSDKDACTFKVIRTMRRENYRPGLSIEDVSNYSYETVDLNVLVGHRQDLVSLGVASLVITGEEEGEHVMKIPVRQSAQNVHHNKGSGKSKGKGSSAACFPHDPEWRYSLEENATLCVGVRVVPLPSVGSSSHSRDENNSCADAVAAAPPPARHQHPQHHHHQQRPKPKSKKKMSNDAAATSNDVIVEVEDEAMLLAQLCRTDDSDDKKKKKGAKRPSRSGTGGSHDSHDNINHTCTGVGGGGGAATSSPGLALMTMLPQGMLCVPANVSASCVDAASHHHQAYLPQDVRDYLLPAHPRDKRKSKKVPMRDVVGGGSRRNHAATRTADTAHHPASSLLSTLSASTDGSLTENAGRHKGIEGERSCAAASSFADSHLLSVQRMIEANLHAMHAKLGASRTPAPPPPPPHPTTTTKPTAMAAKSNPAAAAAAAAATSATTTNPAGPSGEVKRTNNNKSRRPDYPAHRTLEV
jgi:hypothetical protein